MLISMKQYLYLFSDGKRVSALTQKPDDVTVGPEQWSVRGFKHQIGQAITVYTDGVWKGTVGVYDLDDPSHVLLALNHMREHSLALLCRRLEPEMCVIMGKKATCELWAARCVGRQKAAPKSVKGTLLLKMSDGLNRLCFRGE